MQQEHQDWTKQIMDVEINDMEDMTAVHILPYLEFKYPGFKLLTTKKEIYLEGKTMSHCVYTNYWASVQAGNYLVYQVELFGERATLGVNLYDGNITFNQCYKEYNRAVSPNLKNYVDVFISKLNSWAIQNNIIKQQTPF